MKAMKILAVSLAVTVMLGACTALTGCGGKEENEGMINPMKEVDEQGLIDAAGIDLSAPHGAEDVQYFTITGEEMTLAEMRFALDGKKAYLRAVHTDKKEIVEDIGDNESVPDISKGIEGGDISGLYYEWEKAAACEVKEMDAVCAAKDDIGFIAWIDKDDKILYNLCMEENADMDILKNLAEKVIVSIKNKSE